MPLDQLPADIDQSRIIHTIGLTPQQFLLPAVVGTLAADSAATGLLQPGDRIIRIGNHAIDAWDQVSTAIQADAAADTPLQVVVRRGGAVLTRAIDRKSAV